MSLKLTHADRFSPRPQGKGFSRTAGRKFRRLSWAEVWELTADLHREMTEKRAAQREKHSREFLGL